MVFQSPGDAAFHIFNFPVYFYGIIMAFAVSLGILCAYYLCNKYYKDINADFIIDISPYVIAAGILGARLYYCMLNFNYYFSHPLQILNFRQGGLSIHGALLFGAAAIIFFAKKNGVSLLKIFDIFACSAALGQAVGRWGNFFNSEAFGYPTDLPWKLFIPFSRRPHGYSSFEYFHPAFLYESILDLILFSILYLILRKCGQRKAGLTACAYLFLYSLIRIFVENIRIDSALNLAGVPIAIIISLIILTLSVIWAIFIFVQK